MYNVLRDPTDYKLHPHTIRELRLAEENYSDELFIHPPLFVYLSAFLHGFLHIPLHIIPILFQVLTICLLPVLARKMIFSSPSVKHGGGAKEAFSDDVGLHAMILFGCCPIIAFCSQKFWIDNALMMAVTVCATAHVCLINSENYALSDGKSGGNRVYSLMRHLLSGLLFGTVGLNCKITALALLPFSIGWILLQQYPAYIVHNVEDVTDNRTLWKALLWTAVCCGVYLTGAAVAYAPWAYLYWVSYKFIYVLY